MSLGKGVEDGMRIVSPCASYTASKNVRATNGIQRRGFLRMRVNGKRVFRVSHAVRWRVGFTVATVGRGGRDRMVRCQTQKQEADRGIGYDVEDKVADVVIVVIAVGVIQLEDVATYKQENVGNSQRLSLVYTCTQRTQPLLSCKGIF